LYINLAAERSKSGFFYANTSFTELFVMKKISIKTACYLAMSFFAFANSPLYAADIKAGEQKAAQCASCHGAKGISSNGQYPNLAGQNANYLETQLKAFKEGARVNAGMQGVAAKLTEADVENLVEYFASLPNESVDSKVKVPADGSAKFAMCAGCHGSKGEGRGAFPRLANQNAQYLTAQLLAFKNGSRKSPMVGIAKSLSEEDIKTLSAYLSSLKPAKE
jgi:cytochrome c553